MLFNPNSTRVTVVAARSHGYQDPITLTNGSSAPGLSSGIALPLLGIAAGAVFRIRESKDKAEEKQKVAATGSRIWHQQQGWNGVCS